jgi:hypothetical protein
VPVRDPNAPELRAVTALVEVGEGMRVVAPITLVKHGQRVIGVTSAELLRTRPDRKLAIVTKLDGSATIPVASWGVGRYSGVGLVEIAGVFPEHDIVPLPIGSIHASVDVHAAPSVIVIVDELKGHFERSLIPIHVDADDAGGMSDQTLYLASPHHPAHAQSSVEGAIAFAWLPPEPALGRRTSEVVAFGMAEPYRLGVAKPRATPVIAELTGLDDLGRALISKTEAAAEPKLGTVVGEIEDDEAGDEVDPLAGFKD